MTSIYANIHIQNKLNAYMPLENVDFNKDVKYLKEKISEKIDFEVKNMEIFYKGEILKDNQMLQGLVYPASIVHCFQKTQQLQHYEEKIELSSERNLAKVQELFNLIAHIQINVSSRVNIMQKILAEYPAFRLNLGAQSLIRDSVLFNTLHQPEVIKNLSKYYPIIIEAAPFIVDTIKKELTRSTSTAQPTEEPTTDSTTSSEEENSSNSNDATTSTANNQARSASTQNIRAITRQQLQAALAQIGFGSVNSLSNIAQRNSDALVNSGVSTSSGSSASTSDVTVQQPATVDRDVRNEELRREIEQAIFNSSRPLEFEQMDTTTPDDLAPAANALSNSQEHSLHEEGYLPATYRNHQYAEQLRTMAQMGFHIYEENLAFLNMTNGDIESAINLLMSSMN